MTVQVKLKPVAEYPVKDPETGIALPEEGAVVTMSTFWERRLREGVVVKLEEASDGEDQNSGSDEDNSGSDQDAEKGKGESDGKEESEEDGSTDQGSDEGKEGTEEGTSTDKGTGESKEDTAPANNKNNKPSGNNNRNRR